MREGKLGANKQQLSPELHAAIEYRWREVLLPATGYASYEEMRRGVNRELGRPFCKS